MKPYCTSILVTVLCLASTVLPAQSHPAYIATVLKQEEIIEFSVASTIQFYVGDNIYILHIGDAEFKLSTEHKTATEDIITFLIPQSAFNALQEDAVVWMSYGEIVKTNPRTQEDASIICQQCSKTCWCLGAFTRSLLSR